MSARGVLLIADFYFIVIPVLCIICLVVRRMRGWEGGLWALFPVPLMWWFLSSPLVVLLYGHPVPGSSFASGDNAWMWPLVPALVGAGVGLLTLLYILLALLYKEPW